MTARRVWTSDDIAGLGVKTTVPVAGEIIGNLSATQAYAMHARGEFPLPVLKVGRKLFVPVSSIAEFLRIPIGPGHREQPADLRPRGEVEQPGNIRQLRSGSHAT
jgi:hypothetical protein